MPNHAPTPVASVESPQHTSRLEYQASTSWTVIAAMACLMVIDRLGSDLTRTNRAALLALSALVGTATIALILRTASQFPWQLMARRTQPVVLILVLTGAAICAAIAGHAFDVAFELPVQTLPNHLFQRTGWATTVLLILGLGTTAITKHRRQSTALVARATALEHTYAEVNDLLTTAVPAKLDSIIADVHANLAGLANTDAGEALRILRLISDQIVRASSHRLAAEPITYRPAALTSEIQTPSLGALMVSVADDRPLRPGIPATLMAVWVTSVLLATASIGSAMVAGVITGALAATSLAAGSLLVRQLGTRCTAGVRVLVVVATTVAASLCWVMGTHRVGLWLELAIPLGQSPIHTAAQTLIFAIIPFSQMLIRAVARHADIILSELQRITAELEFHVARANATLWAQQRALARELHGPMQSIVSAAALRLADRPTNDPVDPGAVAHITDTITSALTRLQQEQTADGGRRAVDVEHAVAMIRGLWDGVCDIHVDCSPPIIARLSADPIATEILIHALTEACSNAIRHGQASTITAHIASDGSLIELLVTDNGTCEHPGPPGEGSAFLDEVTVAWNRTHGPTGTRLSALFAWS